MPAVSVIIPAYNSERFIKETLDCLLKQTLKDIEVVIVNDGSTDSTGDIIAAYCEKYPFIKGLTQPNAGVSAARNHGLRHATGEYVVFLDADDLYTEDSLRAFYDTAVRTGADCVIGRLRNFDESGMGKFNAFGDYLAAMETIPTFTIQLLWNFLVSNKCYKRQALIDSGVLFPPYTFSEEGAFFMSFVYAGATLAGCEGSCMCYRRHTKKQGLSVSQTVSKKNAANMIASLSMITERAKEAVKTAPSEVDREEYIGEILYKTAYILVSQFYRFAWQCDEECFDYVVGELLRLKGEMSEKRFRSLCETNRDLPLESLCRSRKDFIENAKVSVILKPQKGEDYTAFLDSLYGQVCPAFQLIVPQSYYETMPEEFKKENITVVADRHYAKNAVLAAKAKQRMTVRRNIVLDSRLFRLAAGMRRIPQRLRETFFGHMAYLLRLLLKKM